MKSLKLIKNILYGIIVDDSAIKHTKRFAFKGITSPPSYMAFLSMLTLGIDHYGDEKVAWGFDIIYKNKRFTIEAFGRNSWAIECDRECDDRLVIELKNKIAKASKVLQGDLDILFKRQISQNNYYLFNNYLNIYPLYRFYYKKTRSLLKRFAGHKKSLGGMLLNYADAINKIYNLNKETAYYLSATITFFYSYTEYLFDGLLAFTVNNYSLRKFMNLKWPQRFNYIFPVKEDREIRNIYEELYRIKKIIRDQLCHGFNAEARILVSTKQFGILKASYIKAEESIHYDYTSRLGGFDSYEIIKCFDAFERWLNKTPPFCHRLIYLKSGLPIPFSNKEIKEIKLYMKSKDKIRKYIRDKKGLDGESDTD